MLQAKTNQKIKITFLISSLKIGGTEKRLFELVVFLAENYLVEIIVIVFNDEGYFLNKLLKFGINVKIIKGNYVKRCIHLYKFFIKTRPKIIHVFNFSPGPYVSIVAKLAKINHVYVSTGASYVTLKINYFLYRIIDGIIDEYICNSDSGKSMLIDKLKIEEKKIQVLKNGIDFESLDKMHEQFKDTYTIFNEFSKKIIVGSVGNLLDDKDPMNFVKSALLVKEKTDNVIFILVGSGPLEDELRSFIKQNQLDKCFFIFNNRTDGPSISKYFDICVLSSKTEALPNVLLEYMYWSKPIVATDVGDCSKIIVNNETGFIVPPEDPYLLSKKILDLVANKKLIKKLGANGKLKLLNEHSLKSFSEKIMNIYMNPS